MFESERVDLPLVAVQRERVVAAALVDQNASSKRVRSSAASRSSRSASSRSRQTSRASSAIRSFAS